MFRLKNILLVPAIIHYVVVDLDILLFVIEFAYLYNGLLKYPYCISHKMITFYHAENG